MYDRQYLIAILIISIFAALASLLGVVLQRRYKRQIIEYSKRQEKDMHELLRHTKRVDSAVAGERNEFKRKVDYLQGVLKQQNIDVYRQIKFADDIDAMIGQGMTRNLRGWAISPDALLAILHYVEEYKPKVVLELGGGYSTVALARLIDKKKLNTRVISVDHDVQYLSQTKGLVGDSGAVEYVHAPLKQYSGKYSWYDTRQIKKIIKSTKIDCVVVDGPPESTNPFARRPVHEQLQPLLASRYSIILDDAGRPDEKAAVEDWLKRDSQLTHHYIYTEKGLSIVTSLSVDKQHLL